MARQRYRVTEKIDMGGMAEIYRGRATSLEGIEKEVAIKRVLPQLTRNQKFIAMFLDEARLSMHLNHANIVQVFDVGRADETYFIVMEYVDGYNLRRVFQRANETNTVIPVEIAAYIMMQVCAALDHAHSKKGDDGNPLHIVHRDVSPPNVLLSRSGEVKLTDFGLAKAVSHAEITDPGIVKGKFSYLSPEAAGGQDVDHRADIFCVGIILFELLANRTLFLGKSDGETVELVEKAEVPSISRLNEGVPREFELILNKTLARDPRDRFTSAQELGNRLAEWLFAENLKVTSYDLAQFLGRLFGDVAEEDPTERIDAMIAEEVLNLSMLGAGADSLTVDGSRPIDSEGLNAPSQGSGRIALQDIWPEESAGEGSDLGAEPEEPGEEGLQAVAIGLGLLTVVLLVAVLYWYARGGSA
jgi:serine/threonine-protein kinase